MRRKGCKGGGVSRRLRNVSGKIPKSLRRVLAPEEWGFSLQTCGGCFYPLEEA
jgi:hypothetical protein